MGFEGGFASLEDRFGFFDLGLGLGLGFGVGWE